jgi:transcriptional regulator with XRE-family HTH domain
MESKTEFAIGQLLLDFRLRMAELDINFAELARRLDLSRARVSELFRSRPNPTISTLDRIAEVLGCRLIIGLAPAVTPIVGEARGDAMKPLQGRRSPVLRVTRQPKTEHYARRLRSSA